jgi:hypothetical protein
MDLLVEKSETTRAVIQIYTDLQRTVALILSRVSVDIATGWTAGVLFPAEASDSALAHSVQNGSGASPVFFPRK